ncbi:MAG: hypothetical protein Q7J34_10890 [Bacteroidales bacterium]|nr:hypothetical protein [Bacteroidales bacterium]
MSKLKYISLVLIITMCCISQTQAAKPFSKKQYQGFELGLRSGEFGLNIRYRF